MYDFRSICQVFLDQLRIENVSSILFDNKSLFI